MSFVSIKTALHEAIRHDTAPHAQFMSRLQSDIHDIGDILKSVYQKSNPNVTISSHSNDVSQVSLHYSMDHYPTEADYSNAVQQCIDNGGDLDDIEAFTDYHWTIKIDEEQQKFIFEYDGFPSGADIEDTDDVHEETYDLTEADYQALVCRVSEVLNRFIPLAVKIDYFRESSHRQGQQMLNFVIE